MKSNHFKRIIFICVLICLFTISTVQAQNKYTVEYKDQKKTIKYGEPFSVEIIGLNNLDYDYSIKIDYELPKPQAFTGPQLSSRIDLNNIPNMTFQIMNFIIPISKEIITESLNKLLKERLTKFGKEEIKEWFNNLTNDQKSLIFENPDDKLDDEVGYRKIKEKDIVDSMLKTKPGGSITITIEAKARKWKIGENGEFESKGDVVNTVDDLKLNVDDSKEKKIKEAVINHIETKTIRFEFEGPKGITFSFGPYLSLFQRYEYGRVKNPDFEEGSTDANKKNKYYIGFTEESDLVYGIAAFWNAPLWKERLGVCWGVAYNLQEKIDKGISGLMGFYFQPKEASALINFGICVGQVKHLAEGYIIKAGIGENEEIPLKTKLKIGAFISISFKI